MIIKPLKINITERKELSLHKADILVMLLYWPVQAC